jgi:hypothetical protein
MKNFSIKFLRSSKKLEGVHTARKSREVDEIWKFGLQLEAHNHIEMFESVDDEQAALESRKYALDETIADAQRQDELTRHELLETEDFETNAFEVSINGSLRNFSETQNSVEINQQTQLKQLPESTSGPFDHELSDLAEVCLQRELEKNDAAVKQIQEEDEENERQKGPIFFNPRSI